MPAQPALSEIVFPSASEQPNLSHLLTDLKKSNLSIANRLRSIRHDAEFVQEVARAFSGETSPGSGSSHLHELQQQQKEQQESGVREDRGKTHKRPLVANERCGSWYVPTSSKAGSAYFKSTDGHAGAWQFSQRRLNLHLLEIVGRHDGCIIVDSTRRGKRMPDALSKTIPVWCTVLNRALFPHLAEQNPDLLSLFTPPQVVSPSEHAQIEALLPSFLTSLQALNLDLPALRGKVTKPLRPLWVTPDTDLDAIASSVASSPDPNPTSTADGDEATDGNGLVFDDFHPVICCTASKRVPGGELTTMSSGVSSAQGSASYVYVQGAGDDTENWACDLTAELWWANAPRLIAAPEADLPVLVRELVEQSKHGAQGKGPGAGPKGVAPGVAVTSTPLLAALEKESMDRESDGGASCVISLTPTVTSQETWRKSPRKMEIGLGKHKVASRNLRVALPEICNFAGEFIESRVTPDGSLPPESKVIVACESGRDLSVAVALAINIWCFDDNGRHRPSGATARINKDIIKMRLGVIMTAYPEANPGRASLQSVNSFLMDYKR